MGFLRQPNHPGFIDHMGTATQIRNYRVRTGKSAATVAAQLGLNDAWYADLECHDDELANTLTLFQGIELATTLGAQLPDLVGGDMPAERIALTNLPAHVRAHLASQNISIEEFEADIGWELSDLLRSPIKAVAELPMAFLQALAAPLGINWLALVPDENAD